jgi:hypothetical protein
VTWGNILLLVVVIGGQDQVVRAWSVRTGHLLMAVCPWDDVYDNAAAEAASLRSSYFNLLQTYPTNRSTNRNTTSTSTNERNPTTTTTKPNVIPMSAEQAAITRGNEGDISRLCWLNDYRTLAVASPTRLAMLTPRAS